MSAADLLSDHVREEIDHWKARGLDYSRLFHKPEEAAEFDIHRTIDQNHPINEILDRKFIVDAAPALDAGTPVSSGYKVTNHFPYTGELDKVIFRLTD